MIPQSIVAYYRKNRSRLMYIRNYFYDYLRYLHYSGIEDNLTDKNKLQATLITWAHVVEKGLTLPSPRPGYGKDVVDNLIKGISNYMDKFGSDNTICISINILQAYYKFNLDNGLDDLDLKRRIEQLINRVPKDSLKANRGGVKPLLKEQLKDTSVLPFKDFIYSRYSIRNFTTDRVSLDLINEAVRISLKSPSVCNRQAWRVHCYQDYEQCQRLLQYQNGNRGFNQVINTLLIVTCDLNYFNTIRERNQAFIDGGMFGMTLIYALHSLGLGSCCLNLCHTYDIDKALREEASISDGESFIFMLAVGHIPETVYVAESSRKSLKEILFIHN